MSITSQITALNADKTAIANAITAKGGTLSQNPGFYTFAADIATIPTGATEAEIMNKYFTGRITNLTADCFIGLTSIREYMFDRNTDIVSVSLPSTITSIQSYAFQLCSNLETIHLSEGLTELNNSAFSFCNKLNNVVVPSSVTLVGQYVFNIGGSTNKKTFTFMGTTPPTLQQYAMKSADSIQVIYVPHGLKPTYVAASSVWATYESVIEELPQS